VQDRSIFSDEMNRQLIHECSVLLAGYCSRMPEKLSKNIALYSFLLQPIELVHVHTRIMEDKRKKLILWTSIGAIVLGVVTGTVYWMSLSKNSDEKKLLKKKHKKQKQVNSEHDLEGKELAKQALNLLKGDLDALMNDEKRMDELNEVLDKIRAFENREDSLASSTRMDLAKVCFSFSSN
jgi:hypothetical protein